MRKFLLIICNILFIVPSVVAAEVEQAVDDTVASSVEGIHPYKTVSNLSNEFTHWSLTFEGGINMIDGDFQQPNITIIPRTRVRPSGAFSVTYDFTPIWGLTGMYTYAPYGVMQKETDTWLLNGQMHIMNLLINFDLIDAWFPNRKTDIFSLYFLGGLGLAVYNCDYTANGGTAVKPRADGKYNMAGAVSLGVAAEFNVGRSVGLGLKGLYHIFTSDLIDTRIRGANNDCMEYASLYLRWKIAAKKKNHKRNYSNDAFATLANSTPRKPQKDTLVVLTKDTLIQRDTMIVINEPQIVPAVECYYLYFKNNSYKLTEEGLQIIQQAADRLLSDSATCFVVTGYCDHTGSAEYNQSLGLNRANRVIKELTTVYGIDASRLVAVSKGRVSNVNSQYGPNRRVELRVCKREDLPQSPVSNTNSTISKPISTAVESPNKTEEGVDIIATVLASHDVLSKVTTTEITTFARISRKYYGNTYCWPYVYAANRGIVMGNNPDKLIRGAQLVIPKLSEVEISSATPETVSAMLAVIQAQ